jgi:hypothetical protein
VDVYYYFPKWRSRGRFAGFEATRRMLNSMFDPKLVLAFLCERPSSSTLNAIGRAQRKGIEVVVRGGLVEASGVLQPPVQPGRV